MRLDICSHHVKVSELGGAMGKEALLRFCAPLIRYKLVKSRGRFHKEMDKVFAAATKDRTEFRFHVNQLEDLLLHLRNYGFEPDQLLMVRHSYKRDDFPVVEHRVKKMFDPRANQVPVIDYVIDDGFPQKIVTLPPGAGKTFVAMRCMWLLKVRGIYTFKGGYTDRWVEAFNETFDYEKGDLVVVRGSAALVKLMRNAKAGEPIPKVLIMSFGTWRDYLKDYEASNGKSKIYPISPDEFFVKLGIGYRVIDEVHQEFHLNFKIDLYTHVYKSLSLSGTMESSDAFMNRMYCIPYPVQRRNDGGGAKPHIAVKALFYKLSLPKIIRYKGAQGGYSHNAFEESLMSKKGIFPNYLKLIHKVVECYYGSVREDGQKMLIFCASVSLCTIVRDYLQKMYPTLTVTRYCQGDEYQDLLDADIGVSTVLSAGTAVDIPNLRVTLMTTSIDSRQSNEQALGRTRPLKDWLDVIPLFLYLVCEDIDRHIIYHENKMNFFKGKVLSHEEEELDFVV